jgi:oligopeptide/dipeptide ABC transporter ATP-binding protein
MKKFFPIQKGILKRVVGHVKAVNDISINIYEGETLGLVGESGCGKSTLGRSILRLTKPTAGRVVIQSKRMNQKDNKDVKIDITSASKSQLKQARRNMQIIFQDPYSSLSPRMKIGDFIGEPFTVYSKMNRNDRRKQVNKLLVTVGLKKEHFDRYPHEFSGGQRQRIGIARALALEPQFIVADEPLSALDVSTQLQILNLLRDLQKEFGLTYLFISHDLAVVKLISDRIAVMYLGKIMELADAETIFKNMKHPYTQALISAIPIPDPDHQTKRLVLKGDVPNPVNIPTGCLFHPRCQYVEEVCKIKEPSFRDIGEKHWVSCHFAESLCLQNIF